MSGSIEETDGICILSFDNGGPGTYSQLLILKEKMSRLASDLQVAEDEVYPADYFDLMGGVGFGGLVAIILGLLRMNIDEAIDALIDITSSIFPDASMETIDQESNTKNLREAVESMLQARNISPTSKMNDEAREKTRCKVVLYTANSQHLNHPQLFRTYSSRGSSLNPTILEAICATVSLPSHFLPVKIGPPRMQQSFLGSVLGGNNPTRLLLEEASKVYGKDRRVAQIISLGCGLPRVLSVNSLYEANANRLLKEIAADCEMVANELSTRLFNIDAYLRLNVNRGMETLEVQDWYHLGMIESHTTSYLSSTVVSDALDSSLRRLQERAGTTTLSRFNHFSSIKAMAKTALPVSPYFVLREKPWNIITSHLVVPSSSRQKIFPITGMGGCGKTQLVSYFLREYPNLYVQTIYVDASSSSSIKAHLQTWARALGGGHERDVWEDAMRILKTAPRGERWILVFDNADNPRLNLTPFLPINTEVTIVITSRNHALGNLSTTHHLELGEMTADEALAAMLQAARRQLPLSDEEMGSAQELLMELGCLAVALVQAGTYCRQLSSTIGDILRPYTFTQYLRLFKSHRADLMKKAEPSSLDNYQRGAYTTLDLSYTALAQESRDLLHILSLFHYSDIPLAAFARAATHAFKDQEEYHPRDNSYEATISKLKDLLYRDMEWNEIHLQEIIQNLRSFSLVTASTMNDSLFLQLHPLIQAWCRDMKLIAAQPYRAMTMQVLTACGIEDIELNRFLLPHMMAMLSQIELQGMQVNDLVAFGQVSKQQGHYRKAGQLFQTALESMRDSTRADAIKTLHVTSLLAANYVSEGRWAESEKLYAKLVKDFGQIRGEGHPETMAVASSLATSYYHQGRWIEAEKLLLKVAGQHMIILGMDHPETIKVASMLAASYSAQGRWAESERLEVDALAQRKRILGIDHPDTILSAANLAMTYRSQGRLTESEKLGVEVLEQRRRILGIEHPETVFAASNLSTIYQSQGRWAEAEKLGAKVLEQRRRILGVEHPDTIKAALNLVVTYASQGRWAEAEKLGAEVLEQQRRIQGSDHPDAILAAANLSGIYQIQNRYEEATALLAPAVQAGIKVLGQDHPNTQADITNLTFLYEKLGQSRNAQEISSLLYRR